MKLTGYVFTPKKDITGAYIYATIASWAKYSRYPENPSPYTPNSLQFWATKPQIWIIKRFLNKFKNLEYTLEEM